MCWLSPVSTPLCSLGRNCYRSIPSLCGRGIPAVTMHRPMYVSHSSPQCTIQTHTPSHTTHPHIHITHKHHTHTHTQHTLSHIYHNTHHTHTPQSDTQIPWSHTHLHTKTPVTKASITHTPLGEGLHFKHFPQLHFPPPIMADFLHMLSRFMSLDGGLRRIEVSPSLGQTDIRLSIELVTTPDCIR